MFLELKHCVFISYKARNNHRWREQRLAPLVCRFCIKGRL